MQDSPVIGPLYTGRVIVRLTAEIEASIRDRALARAGDWSTLRDLATDLSEGELLAFLDSHPQLRTQRLVTSQPVSRMLAIEQTARGAFPRLESLSAYYLIDDRGLTVNPGRLLSEALDLPQVRRAYRELNLADPFASGDFTGTQGYLDDAPLGIGARPLIAAGYTGAGIGLIDVEEMWNLKHEDLQDVTPAGTVVYNDNLYDHDDNTCGYHGTSVLGIILGIPSNGLGIDGIAPGARPSTLSSRYVHASGDHWDIAGAILKVIDPAHAAPGDVMLIEVQTANGYPVEISDHCFSAIQLAVGNGIIVLEAAGNGNHNLDLPPTAGTDPFPTSEVLSARSLDRASAMFADSGAIMIGACTSTVSGTMPGAGHARWPQSNFGSRVDCHAWGEAIAAPGEQSFANPPICDTTYNLGFGGTSGATAIIGGAVLLLQDLAVATKGARLTPSAMRTRISDPALGTPQVPLAPGKGIGVMPNLSATGLAPDVFVRDSILDLGATPNVAVFSSPDIIVRAAASANPNAEWGQGSGTEEIVPPNDLIVPNAINFVYVRMQNRGLLDAAGVTATVYWSEASSLVAPVEWNLIGTSAVLNVPATRDLVVTAAIQWDTSGNYLPATGHGCFVAVLAHVADPAPVAIAAINAGTGDPTSWGEFLSYVGDNNNVAWRNFSILGQNSGGDGPLIERFFVRGAPDQARRFDLEVLVDVPRRTRVSLAVPRELIRHCIPPERVPPSDRDELVELALGDDGRLRLDGVLLQRRARIPCELRIELPRRWRPTRPHAVAVRQIWEGIEVGRITWALDREG